MARRNISTILITLTVAVMVGIREATGLAPPPPTLGTEEVVWLAPERDGDAGLFIVLEDPEPRVAGTSANDRPSTRPRLFTRILKRLRIG